METINPKTDVIDHNQTSDTSCNNLSDTPGPLPDFKVGFAEDMNRRFRRSMEDSHCYVYDFGDVEASGFFGIFDGHAGSQSADWCGENFHELFRKNLEEADTSQSSIVEVLSKSFTDTDKLIKDALKVNRRNDSGCTAVVSFIRNEILPSFDDRTKVGKDKSAVSSTTRRVLYTGNVGDARAVLCRSGRALRLTHDHKTNDPQELKRIIEAGGFIMNNRVNGVLMITRSLGDLSMKEFIISQPYTTEICLEHSDEFLILACDGLWDVMSDQEAVSYIRDMKNPEAAADALVKYALSNNCTDNISCMVVRFCDER